MNIVKAPFGILLAVMALVLVSSATLALAIFIGPATVSSSDTGYTISGTFVDVSVDPLGQDNVCISFTGTQSSFATSCDVTSNSYSCVLEPQHVGTSLISFQIYATDSSSCLSGNVTEGPSGTINPTAVHLLSASVGDGSFTGPILLLVVFLAFGLGSIYLLRFHFQRS